MSPQKPACDYVIRYRSTDHGSYFDCRTGIGPKFGLTKDKATGFLSRALAAQEMLMWLGFADIMCEVEPRPLRLRLVASKDG